VRDLIALLLLKLNVNFLLHNAAIVPDRVPQLGRLAGEQKSAALVAANASTGGVLTECRPAPQDQSPDEDKSVTVERGEFAADDRHLADRGQMPTS
jgi:hypothetical protein